IAASNRDLREMVRQGQFREDLYYRLNVVNLHIPPLRQRRSDVGALAEHFVKKYSAENGKAPLRLAPDALARLMGYPWPGNVRELENVVERAVVLAPGETIDTEHLPPELI